MRLTRGEVLERARALAEYNESQIEQIDSALRAGELGPPESKQARQRAHLLARRRLRNLYHHLFQLATDSTRIYEADEATLAPLAEGFSEALFFPVAQLRRLRVGLGGACLRYDVSRPLEGHTMLGGRRQRFRIKDVRVDGRKRRLLCVDYASAAAGRIQILFADHYTFETRYFRNDSPPAPYELYLVDDIKGGWLRRFGVHRPSAFMYWVSSRDAGDRRPTEAPLVGCRIYVPGLRFRLPLILPDIKLNDLRKLGLPMPLLRLEYLRQGRSPGWLPMDQALEFTDWQGTGAPPSEILERFPDR